MNASRLTTYGLCLLFTVSVLLSATAAHSASATRERRVAPMPDARQFNHPSVPVVVVRIVAGPSEPSDANEGEFLIKEVIVENRSSKAVASVTVRWAISPINDRVTAFKEGSLQPHLLSALKKTLLPGKRQTLKLSHPKIPEMLGELRDTASMGDEFALLLGVGEVVFEDGTTWKEKNDVDIKSRLSKRSSSFSSSKLLTATFLSRHPSSPSERTKRQDQAAFEAERSRPDTIVR